ncbi:hypothetical protein ACLI4Z_04205 [Natrialbaceae archaeon A-arb3/5]
MFSVENRSQSELIGVVLLFAFTILSASALFVVGLTAVDSHQQTTEVGAAENELALLGSKVSDVALGESSVQTVSTANTGGTYGVNESAGTVTITHYNWTEGSDETIGEFTLGDVTYSNDNTKVAYQGGGVWRHEDDHTAMVSPPEFHYRYGTLTLPVINVTGDERWSGQPAMTAENGGETDRIYPNPDTEYDNDVPYENPIENGTVEVTVQSEYYRGWSDYFEERTGGNVSVDHDTETATVELITLGDQGNTTLTDGDSVRVRAAEEEEPMNNFSLTLAGDGSSGLNNLDWTFEINGKEVVQLHGQGHGGVDVTFQDPDDEEWVWEAEDAYQVDDSGHIDTLDVNLTTNETTAAYTGGGEGYEDTQEIYELFNELIERHGPNVDLTVEDKSGAQRVDHSRSHAYIDYDGEGFVTYLQITENDVNVSFS